MSRREQHPEGFVIFDDVFVPDATGSSSTARSAPPAVFAHSLGLWERLGGLSDMADDGDLLVGLAQLIAEANGLAGVGHIKEKISEMIIYATLRTQWPGGRDHSTAAQHRGRLRLPGRAVHQRRPSTTARPTST